MNAPKPVSDPKADSAAVKDDAPDNGLYVVVFPINGGGQGVELHTSETAAARVSLLTYGSKQHRKEVADRDEPDLPEGGGAHEINRADITVFKLGTSVVTDF